MWAGAVFELGAHVAINVPVGELDAFEFGGADGVAASGALDVDHEVSGAVAERRRAPPRKGH